MNATESLDLLKSKADSMKRATQRVRDAASVVVGKIEDATWEAGRVGKELPRGYRVSQVEWRGQSMNRFHLHKDTGKDDEFGYPESFCVDGDGGLFAGDFNMRMPAPPTLAQLQEFARDLQEGLLEEIAEHFGLFVAESNGVAESLMAHT